jgi:glutathione peroxidase
MQYFTKLLCAAILFTSCQNSAQSKLAMSIQNEPDAVAKGSSIHDYKVIDLYGKEFDFSKLKGKKVIVVNTASECGLTPQYKDLQALSDKYQDRLVIVGFPANNFGEQEPGSNKEIAHFCELNYGVKFPMMEKISVKGDDMAPIYQFLTKKEKNGIIDSEVMWNFQKYLIDEKGMLVKVIEPKTLPTDKSIISWIESGN